jgi:type IV pilus assembly protein PilW
MRILKVEKTQGFTLFELLVAIGLGMSVLAVVTTTFIAQAKVYNAQEQIKEMEQNARGVLDMITRELKMAGYKPNGGSFSGLPFSATELRIQADVDGNGSIPSSGVTLEDIRYSYDSANIRITRQEGPGGSVEPMANNITAFIFTYVKADGSLATSSADTLAIRQINITITARTAKPVPNYAANNGYRTYTLAATVTPPNLAL